MAAIAAVNRPSPAHPGPNGGNLHSRPNGGIPNSGQQDPGLHGASQDPGHSSHPHPHPQHHASTRPVFYVPAPPPPHYLHYQWPMPFSYNPFAGFPGMGYGMVMPPFPPPPYMEAPTYILPHPHIQPVDYRRLFHPQVHAPSAPYQNPNQNRRVRLPHTVPIRETVNSEVQTEPTQRGVGGYGAGSPRICSDSGHDTASNSPSSSSSSQKQGSVEVENYTLPSSNAKDSQVNRTCTSSTVQHGFNIPHPTGTTTVKSCIRATLETQKSRKDNVGQEKVLPCTNSRCNMWSVGSPDSMVPVCSSSQQEDDVVKERRVSVPDILMSWGGGTPQAAMLKMAEKLLPQNDHQLPSYEMEVEHEKSLYQSPTETETGPVVTDGADANDDAEGVLSSKDSETLFKILKLPFALHELLSDSRRENEPVGLVGSVPYRDEPLHSPNKSYTLPDNEQGHGDETNPHENTTEIIPYQMSLNSCQMKRNMNESVWSVESLAAFIPTKEWLLRNGYSFEPEVIVEVTEKAENGSLSPPNDNLIVKAGKERRQTRRFSSSDSVSMSDSWLMFSTPAEKGSPSKKPEMGSLLKKPEMGSLSNKPEMGSQSKKPEMESEIGAPEKRRPKQGQKMAPSGKDPLASPTHLPSKMISSNPTAEDVDENRSSEPEAIQSPNQESAMVTEQQEKSPCSPEQQEALILNSAAGKKVSPTGQLILQNGVDMESEDGACRNEGVGQLRNEQLCVPVADQKTAEVSPSKGHLVDCGIQCTEPQELMCMCKESKSSIGPNGRHFSKYSDMKKAKHGKAEGFYMNEHGYMRKNPKRHGQWRNRGEEKQSSQQDAYTGYCGKSRGGNGRNQRY